MRGPKACQGRRPPERAICPGPPGASPCINVLVEVCASRYNCTRFPQPRSHPPFPGLLLVPGQLHSLWRQGLQELKVNLGVCCLRSSKRLRGCYCGRYIGLGFRAAAAAARAPTMPPYLTLVFVNQGSSLTDGTAESIKGCDLMKARVSSGKSMEVL